MEKAGYTVEPQKRLEVRDEDGYLLGEYFADLVVNGELIPAKYTVEYMLSKLPLMAEYQNATYTGWHGDFVLDNMLYDADGDGEYETTALQLLIYAHEELYGGDWGEVNFDALPGSSYFKGGIFGFTENLVYFQNGDFPVDESQQSDYMTVGATSDRIVLEAGDFLDVASFGCYNFLWDQAGGFHLFADKNEKYTH